MQKLLNNSSSHKNSEAHSGSVQGTTPGAASDLFKGHFEFVFVQVSEAVEWFWQNRSVLLLRVHNIFFHQEDNRVPVCCFRYHEDFGVRH